MLSFDEDSKELLYGWHRIIGYEGVNFTVKWVVGVALVLSFCLAGEPGICAQNPADSSSQTKPGSNGQQAPSNQKPAAAPAQNANPFPEDESTVPVLPSKGVPDLPDGTYDGKDGGRAALPSADKDPVASPENQQEGESSAVSGFSSSLSGLDTLLPGSDDEQPTGKHGRKQDQVVPEHHETAAEDENVGKYYLDNKDWRAALSRFQSAMVLDPENPDVYWGLAVAEQHLGRFAEARASYQKVVEYDPGSRHAKDADKALKEPEIANAKAVMQQSAEPGAASTQ
jgi:tetratricopeptide (TPR) repeat protein